ncbi:hypothetical protein EV356DRAFT_504181 [Viridothelium virens]|uniref:Uncharacterized protein n=1 Tax=Viridothelium virens TaxID=1048519 RepID=A0A6A6HL40_VIRVR|nr:hypothetical protein EV356DRAFT_504181 [Viridothelium virens]
MVRPGLRAPSLLLVLTPDILRVCQPLVPYRPAGYLGTGVACEASFRDGLYHTRTQRSTLSGGKSYPDDPPKSSDHFFASMQTCARSEKHFSYEAQGEQVTTRQDQDIPT